MLFQVLEETGFDISNHIQKNDYIEAVIHDQIIRLYIIGYISRETKFQPRTRNEIKACEWFPLDDLPSNKKDMTPKMKMGVSPNAFFMVLPFVKRMRRWVAERNPKSTNVRRTRHKSMGDIEVSASKSTKTKTISQGSENEIQDYQSQQSPAPKYNKNQNHGNHQQASGSQNGNGHGSVPKNTNGNTRKERKHTKRQLFTPQNTQGNSFSPVQKEQSPVEGQDDSVFFNFIAPAWANFKFDRRAILDCLT